MLAQTKHLLETATAALNQGHHREALAAYNGAIEIEPQIAVAWNGQGMAYKSMGLNCEALTAFRKAAQIDPNAGSPYTNIGHVLKLLGRFEEALVAYDRAIVLNPDLAYPWNGRGNAYRSLGRLTEALDSYIRAAQLDPELPSPRNNIGTVLKELGRYDQAIEAFDQAIQLDPYYPLSWYNKGLALRGHDDMEKIDFCFYRFFYLAQNQNLLRSCRRDLLGHFLVSAPLFAERLLTEQPQLAAVEDPAAISSVFAHCCLVDRLISCIRHSPICPPVEATKLEGIVVYLMGDPFRANRLLA